MTFWKHFYLWMAVAVGMAIPCAAANSDLLINEIMFHPASENTLEEFVEVYNHGSTPINLLGWRLTAGVFFTNTTSVVVQPGDYYVFAADLATFQAKHPGVTNVAGGWRGILSRSGQKIELTDPSGKVQQSLRYADDGDWGVREKDAVDFGHRGWHWTGGADGKGKSLELRNPGMPYQYGQNWGSSIPDGGTPGKANSLLSTNIAPMVLNTRHYPLIPKSTQTVTINSLVLDEKKAGVRVTLHYRLDGVAAFTSATMFDDGAHDDGLANDQIYGVVLPAFPNNSLVEYYVEAADAEGLTRTWPAPALIDGSVSQTVNALFQIDDTQYTGSQPLYKVLITANELAELKQINAGTPAPPYPASDQTESHASFNATFISVDGTGSELHYQVDIRNRGNGSRSKSPQSYRVDFPNSDPWKGIVAINLNTQFTHSQLFGSVLYRRAGLPTQESRAVQVRVNNQNLAPSSSPSYGFYVANEVLDSNFAKHDFPLDNGGNGYRGIRMQPPGADLHYLGENPDLYRVNYFKHTNTAEDDWTDLIELTRVLSNSPDSSYVNDVNRVANVDRWMLYFALEAMDDNQETNLANSNDGNGEGDDYYLYRGKKDTRFNIVPYDLDTILGQGDTPGNATDSIFRMVKVPVLNRFMHQREFAPIYYRQLKELADKLYAPENFNPLVDETLTGLVPNSVMESINNFAAERRAFVLSQIPVAITVSNTLPVLDGYPHTTSSTVSLQGSANAITTRTIQVNGAPATWDAFSATWTVSQVALQPGINRIQVEAFDGSGGLTDSVGFDVWYDKGSSTSVSGTLSGDTHWTADSGPYNLSGAVTVPAGSVLTIDPGTSVYFASGATLTISGQLLAEGTHSQRIRFTKTPGATGNWGNLTFRNPDVESHLFYVDFEYGGSNGQTIHSVDGNIFVDYCTFSNTTAQYITLDNSSSIINHSVFPSTSGVELIHGLGLPVTGHAIFDGNYFGTTTGLNDIIDYTGGQRPGAIVQFYNNIFNGGSDDQLDLDGTDAHIEGNIFLHAHQSASLVDTSSAISGGSDSGHTSHITIVRNIFYDCDHAALAKEGNYYTIENNTAVNMTVAGVNFDEPGRHASDGVTPGKGALLSGNIFWLTTNNFENAYVNDQTYGTVDLKVNQSILSGPDHLTNGVDNLRADPLFASTENITYQNIRDQFRLQPGSPAIGTGPNGLDRGALVPEGASIGGIPTSPTYQTNLNVTIAGPGIVSFKYKVNDGVYSAEMPVGTPLILSNLVNGTYTISAIGKNSANRWQESSNAASKTFVVNTSAYALVINEFLASNISAVAINDEFPDLVELYYQGASALDLSGFSLSDDQALPRKFIFPNGAKIEPGQYLVLNADDRFSSEGFHLGFHLQKEGGWLGLSDKSGKLVDSVQYGLQLADYSAGRLADGSWGLTMPTFGGANSPAGVGDAHKLKINEWLADAETLFQNGFIEIYNPDPRPVNLGNFYLSGNPVSLPGQNQFPPLTFLAGGGFQSFITDGTESASAVQLNFKLAPEQGEIGLFDSNLQVVDSVIYGPQTTDVAQGRSPNGDNRIISFAQPTPGASNPGSNGSGGNVTTISIDLLSTTATWKYNQSGDQGATWHTTAFNDSSWPSGGALLYVESDALPAPKKTPLTLGKSTYYFRAHFQVNTNLAGYKLQMETIIDDGAIVYLNGAEVFRLGMPTGTVNYGTYATRTVNNAVLEGPFELPMSDLKEGDNVIAVEVHQANASSSDIVFGLNLKAEQSVTNSVAGTGLVILNEVLANHSIKAGYPADWVELYNPSTNSTDLTDLSLTTDPAQPQKWVFPSNTVLPGNGYLTIYCDPAGSLSRTNTGFSLSASGGALYLFDKSANGGGLLDALHYGIQIAGYSVGRNATGTWELNLPTPNSQNIPAATAAPAQLKINEWLASGSSEDWFELYNPAAQPVDLTGLYLTDDLTKKTQYRIPPLSFIDSGAHPFLQFVADGTPGTGANHTNFKLSASGEAIGLFNANGQAIDTVVFGAQQFNVSQGRLPDGSSNVVAFAISASPEASNFLPLNNVLINEVLPHTQTPKEGAIELYNSSSDSVSIGGWYLSDSETSLKKFLIPTGTSIAPRGYAVFYENQFNPNPQAIDSFALNSVYGGTVYLSRTDAQGNLDGYRSQENFLAAQPGVSFGRIQTSTGAKFAALNKTTFGEDTPAAIEQFRSGKGLTNANPTIGPVVINEIFYYPLTTSGSTILENTEEEFIELRNVSSNAVPFHDPARPENSWKLAQAVDFTFPANAVLNPNAYAIVVSFDPSANSAALQDLRAKFQLPGDALVFGPFAKHLNNSGETVELIAPGTPVPAGSPNAGYIPYYVVDSVSYQKQAPWAPALNNTSLQRDQSDLFGDEPLNWYAAAPTPGRTNSANNGNLDSDGDGIPDAWESSHQLNPHDASDAALDSDGDGLSNLQEYIAGTDPHNPSDALRLLIVGTGPSGTELSVGVVAGKSYTVQFQDSLGGSWTKLKDISSAPSSGFFELIDAVSARQLRFYRVITPAQP